MRWLFYHYQLEHLPKSKDTAQNFEILPDILQTYRPAMLCILYIQQCWEKIGSHFGLTPGMKQQSPTFHEIRRINQLHGCSSAAFLITLGLHCSRKRPSSLL